MNLVVLKGNLGQDPDIRSVGEKGTMVANFSLAVREYRGKDSSGAPKYETFWIKVVAWGRLADIAGRLNKGDTIVVNGKLSIRKYEKKDGETGYSTEVVADELTKAVRFNSGGGGQFGPAEDEGGGGEDLFGEEGYSDKEVPY